MSEQAVGEAIKVMAYVIIFTFLLIFLSVRIQGGLQNEAQLEKAMLIFRLSSLANSMAGMEDGSIQSDLLNSYDIQVSCSRQSPPRQCTLKVRENGENDFQERVLMVPAETPRGPLSGTQSVCMEKSGNIVQFSSVCLQ